jgi:hypothetical protein
VVAIVSGRTPHAVVFGESKVRADGDSWHGTALQPWDGPQSVRVDDQRRKLHRYAGEQRALDLEDFGTSTLRADH